MFSYFIAYQVILFHQISGGLLIAAAHFGASVVGSEINYQIARALGITSLFILKKFFPQKAYFESKLFTHFRSHFFCDCSRLCIIREQLKELVYLIIIIVLRFTGKSSRAGVERNTAKESVAANFRQYGIDVYFMGLVIADTSLHRLWHPGTHHGTFPVFDAIITDRKYAFSPL